MKASFNDCSSAGGCIVLVYILIVVNFQSLLDSFIIITALPRAGGIVWMLFLTHTTSACRTHRRIMCMGSPRNSVLVISFARERMDAATALSKQPCKLDSRACGRSHDGDRDDHRDDSHALDSGGGEQNAPSDAPSSAV